MKSARLLLRRRGFLCAALSLTVLSCTAPQESTGGGSPTAEFRDLTDAYAEDWLALHPLRATRLGDSRFNHLLANEVSAEYADEFRGFLSTYRGQLASIDRGSLSAADQLTHDVLEYSLAMDLEGLEYNLQRGSWSDRIKPFNQWGGSLHTVFPVQASGSGYTPFNSAEDYENGLSRLHQFVAYVDTAIANMRVGLQSGDTHPRACMEKVVPQIEALIADRVEESLFYRPVLNMPVEIDTEEAQRISMAYATTVSQEVNPAYERLLTFFRDEYVPGSRDTSGISAIPGGRDKYRYLVRYFTSTDMTPDEVYEIGLQEVSRIRGEMQRVMEDTGFAGDLSAFFEYVKTDQRFFPFQTVDEILRTFEGYASTVGPGLSSLFARAPRARLEVRATEGFRAEATNAYYAGPTAEDPDLCAFYESVPDPHRYNAIGMESLYLHEGIPGHHFQMSLQREGDLPAIRRQMGFDAFSEGWALYAESLGAELGLYRDPYQYLGRLSNEMERAIRLVVDVGLHWRGWSREEAIEYILDNQPVDEAIAIKRTERYMVAPGQALAYKIGEIKIMQLRRRAEQALGDGFDLRAFHDEVLAGGAVPLGLLEAKMDRWIEANLPPR